MRRILISILAAIVVAATPTAVFAAKCPDPVPYSNPTRLLCKGAATIEDPCFCVDRRHAEAAYLYLEAEKDGEVSSDSGWPMWVVLCGTVVGFGLGFGAGVYVATR